MGPPALVVEKWDRVTVTSWPGRRDIGERERDEWAIFSDEVHDEVSRSLTGGGRLEHGAGHRATPANRTRKCQGNDGHGVVNWL
jgi:hypothetical protein